MTPYSDTFKWLFFTELQAKFHFLMYLFRTRDPIFEVQKLVIGRDSNRGPPSRHVRALSTRPRGPPYRMTL